MEREALAAREHTARSNFKFLAILLGAIVALGHSAHGQPAAPDNMQVCRWDVIINESGFESLDAVDSKTVDTPSALYQGSIYKADDLRGVINAIAAAGGLESTDQQMANTQNGGNGMYYMPQQLYFNYYQGQNVHVFLQGNANGTETYSTGDGGRLHIKLDYTAFNNRLFEVTNGRRTAIAFDKKAKISYDGQLGDGDALMFSAAFNTKAGASYRHLIVWEAFKSDQRYQQFFQMFQDPQRWCQLGPKGIRNAVDIATVWGAQAKPQTAEAAAKWEQKLEDGKVVHLTGFTRTDKWIFCWWDGDGLPVAKSDWIQFSRYNNDRPVWFSANVTGPADQWKMQTPTGHPSQNSGEQQTGEFNEGIAASVDATGKVEVGVAVGPWEQLGEIKKGGTIKVGNVTYSLRDIGGNDTDFLYAQFYPTRGIDDSNLVTLSAVKQDGTEVDPSYMQSIKARNYGTSQPNFQGMGMKSIKTFHVWKRKIQWVSFSGMPTEPVTPPKDQVSPDELAAAVGAQQKAQQQVQVQSLAQQEAAQQAKRTDWDAIPADPTTPKGALRALFESANKGDLQAVRARIKSSKAGGTAMDDLAARYITATQDARALAISRFGKEKVQGLALVSVGGNQMPGLMDLETQMVDVAWQATADGGLTSNMLAVTKGDDGKYSLDLGAVADKTNGLQSAAMMVMLLGRAQSMEYVDQQLKDNPSLTIGIMHLTKLPQSLDWAASI